MSDEKRILISIACGALIAIYFFIKTVILGNSKAQRVVSKAKKTGSIATGTAIKSRFAGSAGKDGRYQSETVTYEYFVNGKAYTKTLVFRSVFEVVPYPQEIAVYYDPGDPKTAFTDDDVKPDRKKQTGCYTSIIITIVAIILVSNLLKLL